ncbi:solute carrier family 25, member 20-like protein [Basidiobolus meristosporus CBS 931.73]|uniref:Solute carrier family 25, member 20-like protein n=1 Tax=Basidiobolus meristosporus CBS 931.73 TaxID=1314790 RepID=A0A1Y1XIB9_9FUNG|nr:solute carrier family 25, member 20-like protein [Basidiobolus meristosporus CBS 931.73]|eukprot:ORX85442.1 solute carrier family 25, member 20-like protein [Basidiobolus meristosporus CBS 931.73]
MTNKQAGKAILVEGWKDFLAGSFGGMAQVLVGHPLDTVKTRLQIEGASSRFKGPLDCLFQTVRHEGFLGLYKGMASPLVGISAVNALLFAAYSRLKLIQVSQPEQTLTIKQIALAGAGAGAINSILASPVELLKIRLQGQYHGKGDINRAYSGPIDCARKLIREGGLRNGLFRGFWVTVSKRSKRTLTPAGGNPTELPVWKLMIAGSCGGISYWCASYPLDVIKSKAQNSKQPLGKNYVINIGQEIYREGGASALFRGFTPTGMFQEPCPINCLLTLFSHLVMRVLNF